MSSLNLLGERVRMTRSRVATFLRRLGLPLGHRARIVYHPDYRTPALQTPSRHAFDVRRADRIVQQLERAGLTDPSLILTPQPLSHQDLLLVHTPTFVSEIVDNRRLAELLHIDVQQQPGLEEDLLHPFLLQAGGTVLALQRAIADCVPLFNLGGGFHHAQRDRAEGFCPINDVAIAIRKIQAQGLAHRIMVVDLDFHQGNGTALIFAEDESVFTLSVHGQTWAHIVDKRNNLDLELPFRTGDSAYLEAVRKTLEEALNRFSPDLAIYLAGADPHQADEMGDFGVSEEGMLDRDLHVFKTFQRCGIPLAVLLAGGYGAMAWTIPYNFICSVLTEMRIPPVYRPSNIRAKYLRVRDSLSPSELKQGDRDLTAADLEELLTRKTTAGLFMDYYTRKGLEIALERYGFFALLRERGFPDLLLSVNTDDPDRQVARIHFDREDPEHLLVELVVRFRTLVTPEEAVEEGAEKQYRMLSIEWMLMQNPRAAFSLDRQRLPGQQHPGLGLSRWMVELLRLMAERLDCMGLMNIPQYYHNAFLYSKQMLCFLPDSQGFLEAMKRDLAHLPLVEASVAIEQGRIRDANSGKTVVWEGQPQVMPVEPALNSYFARQGYIRAVARAREMYRFEVEP